jgi:hypothetical protein
VRLKVHCRKFGTIPWRQSCIYIIVVATISPKALDYKPQPTRLGTDLYFGLVGKSTKSEGQGKWNHPPTHPYYNKSLNVACQAFSVGAAFCQSLCNYWINLLFVQVRTEHGETAIPAILPSDKRERKLRWAKPSCLVKQERKFLSRTDIIWNCWLSRIPQDLTMKGEAFTRHFYATTLIMT